MVLLSYVDAILKGEGVEQYTTDLNMSVNEGSLGILPARVMVGDDDYYKACRLLREADLGHVLSKDKDA